MELTVLQTVVNLKNSTSIKDLLEGFDENQSFQFENPAEAENVAKIISSLLMDPEHCALGVELLKRFLDQSNHISEQKLNLWIIQLLKICTLFEKHVSVFDVIRQISILAIEIPDFKKTFISTHLGKIYDSLNKVSRVEQVAALRCTEACLQLYPGVSGQYKASIEKFLLNFIDSSLEYSSRSSGRCLHLLQQLHVTGVKSIACKKLWQSYHLKLLSSLYVLLNQIFDKSPGYARDNLEYEEMNLPQQELPEEPVQRTLLLYIRFRNLLIWLISAISEPFPKEKLIAKKKILSLISLGLSINCNTLKQNSVYDNMVLISLLPKMHSGLLNLLHVLILALRTHLKEDYKTIIGFLIDTLQWTRAKKIEARKPFLKLRIKTYNLLTLWCKMMHHGSGCESIVESVTNNIFIDITPVQMGLTLKTTQGVHSKMSKKARRKAYKLQNEQSSIAQTYSSDRSLTKQCFLNNKNQTLCKAALRCLQSVLNSGSTLFQAPLIKVIQHNICTIESSFYDNPLSSQYLYLDLECRIEIFNTLYVLLTATNHLCPPCFQYILNIFEAAYHLDKTEKVRIRVGDILSQLENSVHSKKEGLLFPIEIRNVRNAFIKFGQENLLREPTFESKISLEYESEESLNGEIIHIDDSVPSDNISQDKEISTLNEMPVEVRNENSASKTLEKNAQITVVNDINVIDHDEHKPTSPKKIKIDSETEAFKKSNIQKNEVTVSDTLYAEIEAEFVNELNPI